MEDEGVSIDNSIGMGERMNGVTVENPQQPPASALNFGFLDKLLAPSPEVPVENYVNHPLNFDGKISTGRIIRGLEGILDSLNYALVDIIIGLVEKWRERGTAAHDSN